LAAGQQPEAALVEQITGADFRPSRVRPYAIQSVGFIPDLPVVPQAADLRDGGLAQLRAAIATLAAQGRLQRD
jgi:hypothetical protein